MFFNKKGSDAWNSLRNMIILILIAVILIPTTYIILNSGSRGSEIAACKSWVILQSAVKDPVWGTQLKEITNQCITFQDTAKGNKYDMYDTIAKGMHDVWKMYGSGEIDFLSDFNWFGSFDSNIYCFIGDEISFKEEVDISIDDFEEYLSHNFPPGSESTYSEIFMKAENARIDFGSGNLEITQSDKLYVIYSVEKKGPDDLKALSGNILKNTIASFIGITALSSSGLKSLSSKKIATGSISAPRAPAGGVTVSGKFYKGGQFIPVGKAGKFLGKVSTVGFISSIISVGVMTVSDQSIMIPSLMVLISEKDFIKEGCQAGIHYNPKSKKDREKFENE